MRLTTIADVIARDREQIISAWTLAATRAASARGLTRPEISNIMPEFIDALAETVVVGGLPDTARRAIETHVRARVHLGFSLPEIVEELALLGMCIHQASQRTDEPPDAADSEQLFAKLHAASVFVTELFTNQMLEDEQTEKMHLRRVRELVADSLRRGESIVDRLLPIATSISEAMDTEHVLIAVYDLESGSLTGSATTSTASEELRDRARAADRAFLAENAAKHERSEAAIAVVDIVNAVGESAVGRIRRLLSVRCISHVGLLGTIHVGIESARTFAPREMSRLEVFGAWFTLHLDNARLFEELEHQVGELREERELRERFVAVLAHDLRGPLSAAKLTAHLLKRGPGAVRNYDGLLVRLERSLDRSERMIRDLLDANRVHAGERLQIHLAWTSLNEVVADVVDELAQQHGDRFVLDVEPEVRGFWSADELRRALWNLIVNAVKYGERGRPITVRLHRTDAGARLAVHNFGAPIPADELPLVFRAFTRARGSEARGTGWGLGLTLVVGCAQAHGGTVGIASGVEGTELTLDLPHDSRPFQSAVAEPVPPGATSVP